LAAVVVVLAIVEMDKQVDLAVVVQHDLQLLEVQEQLVKEMPVQGILMVIHHIPVVVVEVLVLLEQTVAVVLAF
jgi:hypothetical protein